MLKRLLRLQVARKEEAEASEHKVRKIVAMSKGGSISPTEEAQVYVI
uniref:Uncharacterized protein n=1 Tax=Peronospora matthiolae TaxID=2874970 RepID=A0AAV1V935_9STRA